MDCCICSSIRLIPARVLPATRFFGSEIFTRGAFVTGSGGVAFEASARIATAASGIVAGIFGYNFNDTTRLHDEIDFESLGNDAVAGRRREETNVYSNEPLGAGHPRFVPDGDLTAFHTYRIECFPDRVRWLIDNQLVREDTGHVPQNPLRFHLNL